MEPVRDLDISKLILEKRLVTVEALLLDLDELVCDFEKGRTADPSFAWWLYASKERESLNGETKLLFVKILNDRSPDEDRELEELDVEGRIFRLEFDVLTQEDILFFHEREFGNKSPDAIARSLDFYLKNDAFLPADLTT